MRKLYNKLEEMVRKYIVKPLAIVGLAGTLTLGTNSYSQEFKVNPDARGYSTHPRIAMNEDGFIIAYRSESARLSHIYAQRFDKSGNKIGEEFRASGGVHSSIAMDKEGNFVITSGYRNILAQRFDKFGNKIEDEFQVNNDSEYSQVGPAVAMNNDRFVICWKQFIFDDDPRNAFYAQIFDKDRNRLGDQFKVSDYFGASEYPADIAIRDDGDFVITWDSRPEDPLIRRSDILTKCYSRDGNESCKKTIVNTLNGSYPNIAMDKEGDFVITWFAGREVGIYAQRFDRNGNRAGEEFLVNSYKGGINGNTPSIAINNNPGDFIVTWTSWDQDGHYGGIYAQRFNREGNKVGDEFQVNSFTEYSQHSPQVAMNDNGGFVITWTDERIVGHNNLADIYAQIFHFSDIFFRRGDANRDKELDISDPVNTLKYLFNDNLELKCLDAADANDDGNIDVSDPIYSLNHLFLGGKKPPFPYPWPGKDYTQDNLDCREY